MRIAIYTRVSTQRQAQTQTIEQQLDRLQAYIVSKGWTLETDNIYRDDGYSGAKLNRPGLDSLRDRAALAEFDLVLITAPDRLARNYVHQMLIIEELGKRCIARYIPAEQLDDLVWQDLCTVLTHPEMIAYALERAHGGHWAPQELQAQMELLKKASQQIERQQERLLEAYLADVIKLPELERKRGELSRKLEALKIQAAQLQSKTVQRIELSQITDSIETFCAKIKPTLEQTNFDQKRQLIEWLIYRVIVSDNDVEIRYVVPTQPEGSRIPFCQLYSDYRDKVFAIVEHQQEMA